MEESNTIYGVFLPKKFKAICDQIFKLKKKTINKKHKGQRDIWITLHGWNQQYLDNDNSAWANDSISSRNKLQLKKVKEGEFFFKDI